MATNGSRRFFRRICGALRRVKATGRLLAALAAGGQLRWSSENSPVRLRRGSGETERRGDFRLRLFGMLLFLQLLLQAWLVLLGWTSIQSFWLHLLGLLSDLIYNFLALLSKWLTEIDVTIILTVLQCCGMRIRTNDPTAMKDFIQSVQSRVNELKAFAREDQGKIIGRRMEFMLETICDIKNNKKRLKEDTSQHMRFKKWLQKLRVEEIIIKGLKWSKLVEPDKKGQWWLSGEMAATKDDVEEVANTIDKEVSEAEKMLQLAASQRMNTETRKAIFCIIMSGEDYVDAFEKLIRLDLKGKQVGSLLLVYGHSLVNSTCSVVQQNLIYFSDIIFLM